MGKKASVEKEFKALGTDIYFQIVCAESLKDKAEKDSETLKNFYVVFEKRFSRFDRDSELNQFNDNLGKFLKPSTHFLSLAKEILYYYKLSEGLFDPRIIEVLERIGYEKDFKQNRFVASSGKSFPKISVSDLEKDLIIRGEEICFNQRMDFAGIAKGYITDRAVEMLRQAGFENFLIDSGGDMFAFGKDQKEETWKIDVEGIIEDRMLISLKNEAVATSGIGKRKWESGEKKFHHLIDPKNPENFSFALQSVTVVAETVTEADFWAKMLFLKGKEAGMKFSKENKVKSIFLDYRVNAVISEGMKNNIY
ncbi:MAG: FAD:protein FMN transferase [Candidatus Moraniibacteriota bacterium]